MKKFTSFFLILSLLSGLHTAARAEERPPEPESETAEESPMPMEEPVARETIFTLLDAGGALNYEVDMAAYYLGDLLAAAASGDVQAGREAEENRNAAIRAQSIRADAISFDDLSLLARVIFSEAGSYWLSEEFRLCVGEVVLNRVASPEFPDSIHDVVYQKGQYSVVNTPGFESLAPGEDCVDIALRLLRGERRMVPSVVFQSDYVQGELFAVYSDLRLGTTYFCVSDNIDLYPVD